MALKRLERKTGKLVHSVLRGVNCSNTIRLLGGTAEEKILGMQSKKQALADRLLSNQGTISTKLELEDIDMLFSAIV